MFRTTTFATSTATLAASTLAVVAMATFSPSTALAGHDRYSSSSITITIGGRPCPPPRPVVVCPPPRPVVVCPPPRPVVVCPPPRPRPVYVAPCPPRPVYVAPVYCPPRPIYYHRGHPRYVRYERHERIDYGHGRGGHDRDHHDGGGYYHNVAAEPQGDAYGHEAYGQPGQQYANEGYDSYQGRDEQPRYDGQQYADNQRGWTNGADDQVVPTAYQDEVNWQAPQADLNERFGRAVEYDRTSDAPNRSERGWGGRDQQQDWQQPDSQPVSWDSGSERAWGGGRDAGQGGYDYQGGATTMPVYNRY